MSALEKLHCSYVCDCGDDFGLIQAILKHFVMKFTDARTKGDDEKILGVGSLSCCTSL